VGTQDPNRVSEDRRTHITAGMTVKGWRIVFFLILKWRYVILTENIRIGKNKHRTAGMDNVQLQEVK
jgi:hypothetical protein